VLWWGHAEVAKRPPLPGRLLWAGAVVVADHAVLDRELNGQVAGRTRLLQSHSSTRDERRIKVGSTFAQRLGGARLGDAGGEEAEIVGEGAERELSDACAQDGDRLGR
jgi:hypothetical protein